LLLKTCDLFFHPKLDNFSKQAAGHLVPASRQIPLACLPVFLSVCKSIIKTNAHL
jgi:hypothetical protein